MRQCSSCLSSSRRKLRRVAVIRHPSIASGIGHFAAIQAVAPSFRVVLRPIDAPQPGKIERALMQLADEKDVGLIMMTNAAAITLCAACSRRCNDDGPIASFLNRGLGSGGRPFLRRYIRLADLRLIRLAAVLFAPLILRHCGWCVGRRRHNVFQSATGGAASEQSSHNQNCQNACRDG